MNRESGKGQGAEQNGENTSSTSDHRGGQKKCKTGFKTKNRTNRGQTSWSERQRSPGDTHGALHNTVWIHGRRQAGKTRRLRLESRFCEGMSK